MGAETESSLERYRGYVYLLARQRVAYGLRGKLDPSDLVQQTLLKAHQASDRWRELDDEARGPWLRQILANAIVDEIRRYGRGKRDAVLERSLLARVNESSVRLEALLEADQTSPSQILIRQEQLLALGEALGAMSEDHRRAIELHHLDGYSLADVATRMGRSEASVAGLLRRGLRSLNLRLKKEGAMTKNAESSDDREGRLDRVVADYLGEVDSGLAPDRRAWLVRHPEFTLPVPIISPEWDWGEAAPVQIDHFHFYLYMHRDIYVHYAKNPIGDPSEIAVTGAREN